MLSFHLSHPLKLGSSSRHFHIFPQFPSWIFFLSASMFSPPILCRFCENLALFFLACFVTYSLPPSLLPHFISYNLLYTAIWFAFLFYLTLINKVQNGVGCFFFLTFIMLPLGFSISFRNQLYIPHNETQFGLVLGSLSMPSPRWDCQLG